mmetsp:Transcript_3837/g.9984  ORF Transcript_3837/g.9984 Transcript_3837/m.9984 type:complete len:313 (-) Transcript_3837:194-1132(-)
MQRWPRPARPRRRPERRARLAARRPLARDPRGGDGAGSPRRARAQLRRDARVGVARRLRVARRQGVEAPRGAPCERAAARQGPRGLRAHDPRRVRGVGRAGGRGRGAAAPHPLGHDLRGGLGQRRARRVGDAARGARRRLRRRGLRLAARVDLLERREQGAGQGRGVRASRRRPLAPARARVRLVVDPVRRVPRVLVADGQAAQDRLLHGARRPPGRRAPQRRHGRQRQVEAPDRGRPAAAARRGRPPLLQPLLVRALRPLLLRLAVHRARRRQDRRQPLPLRAERRGPRAVRADGRGRARRGGPLVGRRAR